MCYNQHSLCQSCEVQGEKQRHFLGSECCGRPEPRCAVIRKQAGRLGGLGVLGISCYSHTTFLASEGLRPFVELGKKTRIALS